MKRISPLLTIFLFVSIVFVSCNKDDDYINQIETGNEIDFSSVEIQDFIWQGLNTYYLWKDNVPNLADSQITDKQNYFDLLSSYSNPDDFFESLIYNRENTDKWSWIVDDYIALENSFQGIVKSNGVKYGLSYESGSDTDVLGFVRYVLPNSDASGKDVERGYIFDAIDGQQLTINNYQSLLAQDTYTMNFADLNGGNPISNGKSVELTQVENFVENPVHIVKTIDINGFKIGYIMFNGFDAGFEDELSNAFAQIKADGATELILDLRYNLGGYGYIAGDIASLITGQFKNQVISKEKWNTELQNWFEENHPDWVETYFTDKFYKTGDAITGMNLNKLYVITTGSTASASELLISGLDAYIDVSTIGTTTSGKYTGSITIYDSDNFSKSGDNLNTNHTWAMQPIVLQYTNNNGDTVKGGIEPTVEEVEYISEFTELGTVDEPLLASAISYITGSGKPLKSKKNLIKLKQLNNNLEINIKENAVIFDKKIPINFIKR
ncbi:peptidase S41-like protein [Lutibacter oceani]|uniref:Peptidase S41-like protein n=1 Tax=Lutibacter oceani TaxID=1853311 RepID=A0A3D9RZ42_9FLAO|nr:S41 family peptidase [Lutibacter oceani]REE81772.1 peptidase S41-like protein [Lutibacter oceani]